MGKPTFHISALHPHVASVRLLLLVSFVLSTSKCSPNIQSFGTEFNPQLYKQSMIILRDLAKQYPCYLVRGCCCYFSLYIRLT